MTHGIMDRTWNSRGICKAAMSSSSHLLNLGHCVFLQSGIHAFWSSVNWNKPSGGFQVIERKQSVTQRIADRRQFSASGLWESVSSILEKQIAAH